MSTDGRQDDGQDEIQPGITIDWQRVPRGKLQLNVRHAGELLYCHTIRAEDATERARFIRMLATRAREQLRVEVETDAIERQLLHIIEEATAQQDEAGDAAAVAEYYVVDDQDDLELNGLYRNTASGPVQLSNFAMFVEKDISVIDEGDRHRRFEGTIDLLGAESRFSIPAEEYALTSKFAAEVFNAAGAKARMIGKVEEICRAVSAVSNPVHRTVTTAFGWDADGDTYLTPSVRIDATGIHPTTEDDPIRVDLEAEQCARHLDLAVPEPSELPALKRHVVEDLLRLHDRLVTFAVVAAAALAVLFRFVHGMNRPAFWLVGITGGGKSFLAKLVANFFGDFPVQDGSRVGSWSSTSNFLQRQGFFFRHALYLTDDYKYEHSTHKDVIKLLQNYADSSARGRLRADATTNVSREIRGIMLATGESVPEHSASSLARSVVVPFPAREKEIDRGRRCLEHRERYRALWADFIRHIIAEERGPRFAARVAELQAYYLEPIRGVQNDLRIAGNLALLGGALEEFALYLSAVWPGWERQAQAFIEEDLVALRDRLTGAVRDAQPSELFLDTLRELILLGQVRLQGWTPPDTGGARLEHKPLIGRQVPPRRGEPEAFEISMMAALSVVQDSLRRQGLPPLSATPKSLLDQLAGDGRLLDTDNQPISTSARGRRTHDASLCGTTRKVCRIAAEALLGTDGARRQRALDDVDA